MTCLLTACSQCGCNGGSGRSRRVAELERDVETLRSEHAAAAQQLARERASSDALQQGKMAAQRQVERLTADLEAAESRIHALDADKQQQVHSLQVAEQTGAQLRAELDALRAVNGDVESRVASLQSQIDAREADASRGTAAMLALLAETLAALGIDATPAARPMDQLSAVNSRVVLLMQQGVMDRESHAQERQALLGALDQVSAAARELQATADAQRAELSSLRDQHDEQVRDLQGRIQARGAVHDATHEQLQQSLAEQSHDDSQLTADPAVLQSALDEASGQMVALENKVAELEQFRSWALVMLQDARTEVIALRDAGVLASREREALAETVIHIRTGQSLNDELVEERNRSMQLAQESAARLDQVAELQRRVQQLEARIQRRDAALRAIVGTRGGFVDNAMRLDREIADLSISIVEEVGE